MEDNTFTVKVSPGTKVVVEEVHPGVFDKGGDQVIMVISSQTPAKPHYYHELIEPRPRALFR